MNCNHAFKFDPVSEELYCEICGFINEDYVRLEEIPDIRKNKIISTKLTKQQKTTIKNILYNIRFYSIEVYNQILYRADRYKKKLTNYRIFLLISKYLKENKISRSKMLIEHSKAFNDSLNYRLKRAIFKTPKRDYIRRA